MNIEDMKSSDFLRKIKENPKFKDIPLVSYTRLLTYKLIHSELLPQNQPGQEMDDMNRALDILKENMSLVPGEIVLWVEEAISKQNIKIPPLLIVAAKILRNCKV